MPSGDLRHMATNTETKAHNDKPFFAAALRVAVIGADDHCVCLRREARESQRQESAASQSGYWGRTRSRDAS